MSCLEVLCMTEFSDMSPIFQQEEVLREEYRPNDLPERTDEMEDLHMSLAPAARGVGANNVFLHGKLAKENCCCESKAL